MVAAFQTYLKTIENQLQSGVATEHTYRPALQALLEASRAHIVAINEPKRIACGAPDYQVCHGSAHNLFTLGHVEAKDIGKSLEEIEKDAKRANPTTEDGRQLKRYQTLGNLLLTNYLDFRWYVNGELRGTAVSAVKGVKNNHGRDAHATHGQDARATTKSTAEAITSQHGRDAHDTHGQDARATTQPTAEATTSQPGRDAHDTHGQDARATPSTHGQDARATTKSTAEATTSQHGRDAHAPHGQDARATQVMDLISAFLNQKPEPINSPRDLAVRMARLTHFIRDIIIESFKQNEASSTLTDLRSALAETLIPDIAEKEKIPEFADMFAQTLAYGLFAARCNHAGPLGSFKRLGAAAEIPKTNPFLRDLFDMITGAHLNDEPFAGFVDDLTQALSQTDIEAILAHFGKRTRKEDPVVHFYETFLAAYDPKMRELRGVYFTPEPVVSYIVRSVDHLLKTRFNCPAGLADTATVEYEQKYQDEECGTAVGGNSNNIHGQDAHATHGQDARATTEATTCQHGRDAHATHGQDARATTKAITSQHGRDAHATHGQDARATIRSPRVLILDPACGTGTFPYAVVDHIREEFMRKGNAGMWSGYVKKHLLPRLFGFELLMAPYAVAHLKLGLQLAGRDLDKKDRADWVYDFSGEERLGIYLTNSLEEARRRAEALFGPMRVITQEANAANKVKRDLPIMVVMGNPPYSGHSANRSWEMQGKKRIPTFIGKLIQDYYQVDGKPLGEKNPKWLQDDYVKFIRFGQWRIEQSGGGILAFITNHGYLDNPTFRGMRQQLMKVFSDIYILNLHGNSKKKEKCPDGSKDENVFDIQQGVAIGIFVKEPGKAGPAEVHYADLWGVREEKYEALLSLDEANTEWMEIKPRSPYYLFNKMSISRGTAVHGRDAHATHGQDARATTEATTCQHGRDAHATHGQDARATIQATMDEFETDWKITDILPINSVGIVTARDDLTIQWSAEEVWQTINRFVSLAEHEAREAFDLPKDARDWKVSFAQEDIKKSGPRKELIAPIAYRPFDIRYTYYTGRSRGFICMPRPEVMRHLLAGGNLGLIVPRRVETAGPWQHVLVSNNVTEHVVVSLKTIDCLFPLYLYPPEGKSCIARSQMIAEEQKRVRANGGDSAAQDGAAKLIQQLYPAEEYPRWPNINATFIVEVAGRLGLGYVADGKGDLGRRTAAGDGAPALQLQSLLRSAAAGHGDPALQLQRRAQERAALQGTFGPEDVFHYIYAVFHSPTYRSRYGEFLKIDFPRVPLTSNLEMFRALCEKGEELVGLHLMESSTLNNPITSCPIKGDGLVEPGFPKYLPPGTLDAATGKPMAEGRVYISGDKPGAGKKGQYFEGVPREVWEFQVGGYQVCEKWLKDRRGRNLSYEDLTHYQKIVVALKETIRLMAEIDAAIPSWPLE